MVLGGLAQYRGNLWGGGARTQGDMYQMHISLVLGSAAPPGYLCTAPIHQRQFNVQNPKKYCGPYTYPLLLLYRTHSIFRTPNIKWIPADGLSTGVAWEAAEPETKEICIGGCAIEPWPASNPWGEWVAWTIWGRPQHKEGPLHLHLATKKTLVRHSSTLILQVRKVEKKYSYPKNLSNFC